MKILKNGNFYQVQDNNGDIISKRYKTLRGATKQMEVIKSFNN